MVHAPAMAFHEFAEDTLRVALLDVQAMVEVRVLYSVKELLSAAMHLHAVHTRGITPSDQRGLGHGIV
jgi:hypothetical protein